MTNESLVHENSHRFSKVSSPQNTERTLTHPRLTNIRRMGKTIAWGRGESGEAGRGQRKKSRWTSKWIEFMGQEAVVREKFRVVERIRTRKKVKGKRGETGTGRVLVI